jgi:hypothetical protein
VYEWRTEGTVYSGTGERRIEKEAAARTMKKSEDEEVGEWSGAEEMDYSSGSSERRRAARRGDNAPNVWSINCILLEELELSELLF